MIQGDKIPYVTELSRSQTSIQKRAFMVLISTIISLRTKDQTTQDASERLFKLASTSKTLQKLTLKKIEKAIYPCGFYRVKAGQIKIIATTLENKYKGKVPGDLESLVEFPGVGRKTANLVLTEGFDSDGICVDIHVHRILNRVGLITTKKPDETEFVLREILPKRYWKKTNFWLVSFGQHHCKPVKPECAMCLLRDDCEYGKLLHSAK